MALEVELLFKVFPVHPLFRMKRIFHCFCKRNAFTTTAANSYLIVYKRLRLVQHLVLNRSLLGESPQNKPSVTFPPTNVVSISFAQPQHSKHQPSLSSITVRDENFSDQQLALDISSKATRTDDSAFPSTRYRYNQFVNNTFPRA